MIKHMDAFAVALKAFDEKFYDRVLGITLKPVLKAIEVIADSKKWMELVTLIVPTYNDDLGKIKEMSKWLVKNAGKNVPIHFGRFVPEYKLKDLPRTPVKTLEKCRDIALDAGLKYVYIFNVSPHDGNNTYCPRCKKAVIKRLGFKILENKMKGDKCGMCGAKIPGVWT
jgi:pyruvate formate lyase activating enzyme